jgi:hypothetical protein
MAAEATRHLEKTNLSCFRPRSYRLGAAPAAAERRDAAHGVQSFKPRNGFSAFQKASGS